MLIASGVCGTRGCVDGELTYGDAYGECTACGSGGVGDGIGADSAAKMSSAADTAGATTGARIEGGGATASSLA